MKKFIQWFIGLLISLLGFFIITSGIGAVCMFIDMMNNVGKEFVNCFGAFILYLASFIFSPYCLFYIIKDGIADKWK